MKRLYILASILGLSLAANAQLTVTVGNTTLNVREVITGLNVPWEIIWGPDDMIWFTERHGLVSRMDPESGARTVIADLTNTVWASSESGLLGMALHPDFSTTPYVYLVYTYTVSGTTRREKMVRYEWNGTGLINPQTMIDGIIAGSTHDGSRLMFLPDGTILMTTGDAQQTTLPQNSSSLNGKMLRLNDDGTVPSDNPIPDSYVYNTGHRNSQGMCIGPFGHVYSSMHGATTNDELNIIVPGGNYGWPTVEGFCNTTAEMTACAAMNNYQDPIAIWHEGSTIAPGDLLHYTHEAIPEFQDHLIIAILKNKHLIRLKVDNVDGTTVTFQENLFTNLWGRLRDVCMSPDGRLFIATNGANWSNTDPFTHKIIELKNPNYSPVGVASAEETQISIRLDQASGQLNINSSAEMAGTRYQILDMTGRAMATGALTGTHHNLDVSSLVTGVYVFSSFGESGRKSTRFMIK